jgi:hypothetical protein
VSNNNISEKIAAFPLKNKLYPSSCSSVATSSNRKSAKYEEVDSDDNKE